MIREIKISSDIHRVFVETRTIKEMIKVVNYMINTLEIRDETRIHWGSLKGYGITCDGNIHTMRKPRDSEILIKMECVMIG